MASIRTWKIFRFNGHLTYPGWLSRYAVTEGCKRGDVAGNGIIIWKTRKQWIVATVPWSWDAAMNYAQMIKNTIKHYARKIKWQRQVTA